MKLLAHVNPKLYVKKTNVTNTASHFTITPFLNSKLPCDSLTEHYAVPTHNGTFTERWNELHYNEPQQYDNNNKF